jgi:hypothetical protein
MKIAILFALLASTTSAIAENTESVNTGKGFYLGGGAGASRYSITLTNSSYDYSDPDNPTLIFESSELEDSDSGGIWYAGYQINKIIAVEAGYTDYGNFSKTIFAKNYSQSPESFSVYANIGYTFLNGQLRPFGIAGLGYLKKNQSQAYDRLNFKEDFATLHVGFGVDYYPTILRGLGFRLSFSDDVHVESAYSDSGGASEKDSLWQNYSLLYAGIQFKF